MKILKILNNPRRHQFWYDTLLVPQNLTARLDSKSIHSFMSNSQTQQSQMATKFKWKNVQQTPPQYKVNGISSVSITCFGTPGCLFSMLSYCLLWVRKLSQMIFVEFGVPDTQSAISKHWNSCEFTFYVNLK